MKQHTYEVEVEWAGNDGEGTKTYRGYRRDHLIRAHGKPPILGSSDPAFRGNPACYSPEDLLVASLASCHMLWYLHVCSANLVTVISYHDASSGFMDEAVDGSGAFVRVVLRPAVRIATGSDPAKALALHHEAHRLCFIAKSVNFPVDVEPRILDPGSDLA